MIWQVSYVTVDGKFTSLIIKDCILNKCPASPIIFEIDNLFERIDHFESFEEAAIFAKTRYNLN